MRSFRGRRLAAGLLLLSIAGGTGVAAEIPPSLDDYEFFQYIAAGRYPPDTSIHLDNNGEILMACRNGATRAALVDAGIRFADSQIEFLIAMDLLVRDRNDLLITTFPILDEEATRALRKETATLAAELLGVVEDDAAELRRRLAASGLEKHDYSIMFSYILDGMVWGFFEEYRKVARRALSMRRPFWSGQVWAMRPSRRFAASTQSISHRGVTLKVSSSGDSTELVRSLMTDRAGLRQALSEAAKVGRIDDQELRQGLERFGIVDADGLWSVPVIDEIEKGPIFRAAETVTETLVDAILDPDRVDLEGLQNRYGFRSEQQTLVIVYHELMWDLMDGLEAAGLVGKPSIFENPAAAVPADVAKVAFVVDRRPPRPDRQDPLEPEPLERQDPSEERPSGGRDRSENESGLEKIP